LACRQFLVLFDLNNWGLHNHPLPAVPAARFWFRSLDGHLFSSDVAKLCLR